MALQSYTIYGAPLIQRKQSKEDLDVQVISDSDEPWLSQPARVPIQAKTRFVPAQGEYDDQGRLKSAIDGDNASSTTSQAPPPVGSWYTSLPRRHTDAIVGSNRSKSTLKSEETSEKLSTMGIPPPPTPSESAVPVTKNTGRVDWFKSQPTKSNPGSTTLAEMLRRDPPNVASPHEPPVYYGIGPANKGYEMLSKSGWKEGQPLGPRAGLGAARSSQKSKTLAIKPTQEKKEKWMLLDTNMPKLVIPHGEGGTTGPVDVIDLTDPAEQEEEESSEEEEDGSEMFESDDEEETQSRMDVETAPSTSKQSTAILTPIPVALKHDRKGLGAAKKKRLVTHSTLALRHHIQNGALERQNHLSEMRRLEKERLQGQFGRGKRAYARKAKEEQRGRDKLMEYMAS